MDSARAVELAARALVDLAGAESIPAVEFGLLRGGRLVHHGHLGPGPAGRAFRIASMTKSFTAATVLWLRDRDLLQLDDPVADYVPAAATIGLPAGSPPLRIRHLMTMTAGLPTDDPWGDRQEGLPLDHFDDLVGAGLTFCRVPGIDFEYSNLSYALLGRIINAVTADPYVDVVRRTVLEPLGMSRTTYDVHDVRDRATGFHPTAQGLVEQDEPRPGAFSPMGGLWSTIDDLATWIAFFQSSWGDGQSSAPLGRWSRREMQRPHILARMETDPCQAQSYGMGLYVADHARLGRFIHHSGGYPGFGSHMRWHPASGWGIVALGNRTYAPMGRACAQVLDEIVADESPATEDGISSLWPQTRRAIDLAESLLERWDDELFESMAAMNLDLDEARHERRARWVDVARARGPFMRGSLETSTPAHARWTMIGAHGDVRLEVLMSPESPSRIQSLRITDVEA